MLGIESKSADRNPRKLNDSGDLRAVAVEPAHATRFTLQRFVICPGTKRR